MTTERNQPTGYLVDSHGKKTCVILSIEDYEALLEDLEDLAAIVERRDEELISHDEVTRILENDGLL